MRIGGLGARVIREEGRMRTEGGCVMGWPRKDYGERSG